jgi:hypothetical protein
MLKAIVASLALAVAGAALAQTPPPDAAKKGRRMPDCSQAADPKACEAQREKMRAAHEKARAACEGKQGPERGECMRMQMCAEAKDPARCEARTREAMERRKQAMAACQGKQGEEMRACMQAQRGKPGAGQAPAKQ